LIFWNAKVRITCEKTKKKEKKKVAKMKSVEAQQVKLFRQVLVPKRWEKG
jgi:hypothetical protein